MNKTSAADINTHAVSPVLSKSGTTETSQKDGMRKDRGRMHDTCFRCRAGMFRQCELRQSGQNSVWRWWLRVPRSAPAADRPDEASADQEQARDHQHAQRSRIRD